MIRVLHYGMSPNLGGIETYLLNLSRTIDASRFQFDFVYSDYGQLPVFAPDLPGSRFFGVTPRRKSPRRNRRDLDELFTNERFDVLHFHANTVSYVAPMRAALRRGVRVILHSHSAGVAGSTVTRVLHGWHQQTLPWGRITRVAVSREAGRWMFGDSWAFEAIPNGIDASLFTFRSEARNAVRSTLDIAPDALVVGLVGAFLPAKNHSFALAILAEVVRRRADARLLLVGAGPLEDEVRARAAALGVSNEVLFLGRRSDIPDVLAALDAVIMPSHHEGFPLVALEAQASGLPCFLSDVITSEVAVSSLCHRLPLAAPPSLWAEALLGTPPSDRSAGPPAIRATGFSVETNSAAVQRVYERVLATPTG